MANLLTPTLVFHGSDDARVPVLHARLWVGAAHGAGRGTLVTYHEQAGVGEYADQPRASLRGLVSWEAVDYRRIKGIGPMKGAQLAAMAEIARRMMRTGEPRPLLNRPELIAGHLRAVATGLQVEKFWVLCLDRKNRLIRQVEITSGTATATLAHPREVFRAAVRESATAIACAHNHPSGDPAPSAADMHLTRILREGAKAVDIELIDHVVIGRPECDPLGVGHYSFRSAGIL